ncbi:MAG: SDR family NAD(P)-dependent oxidoreductase [Lachnospiraceae bacterium]|nr:SDR family NAD(P)-dependent oxidoreductase [Lachnospiraceae bacterium]
MRKNVIDTDLSGKVAVVTGAGGVLCSDLAKTLARAGAKVALLNRSTDAIERFAADINAEGGTAKAYKCNVLEKDTCMAVAEQVQNDFGPCDILVNGAGGNNPRAQTDKEFYEKGDIDADTQSFFDLSEDGVDAVFSLNFNGTLIPTQAFARQMIGRTGRILAGTPMGRFGEPKDLEGALLFLVNNEAAGFITGVVLPIDGGFQAYSGV